MAKTKQKDVLSAVEPEKSSAKGMVVGVAITTLIAMGAGAGIGLQFSTMGASPPKEKKVKEEDKKKPVASSYVDHRIVKKLPAIVTNLASPSGAWVRMEGAVIVKGDEEGVDVLAAEIAADTLAYLRTLSLSDIEGASGLAYLRSDLNERATIRSEGRVIELVIGSLIVE